MDNYKYFYRCIIDYLNSKEKTTNRFSFIVIDSLIKSYGIDTLLSCINEDKFINKYPKEEILDDIINNLYNDSKSFDFYFVKKKIVNSLLYLYYYSEYPNKEKETNYINYLINALDGKMARYKNIKHYIEIYSMRERCNVMLDKAAERKERRRWDNEKDIGNTK